MTRAKRPQTAARKARRRYRAEVSLLNGELALWQWHAVQRQKVRETQYLQFLDVLAKATVQVVVKLQSDSGTTPKLPE